MLIKNPIIRNLCKGVTALCSVVLSITALASQDAEVAITDAKVQAVMAVQGNVTADLMRQPEVLGTAIGLNAAGVPVLKIYVDRDAQRASEVVRSLPQQYGNVGVEVEFTDKFRAVGQPASTRSMLPIPRNRHRRFNSAPLAAGPMIWPMVSVAVARSAPWSRSAECNIFSVATTFLKATSFREEMAGSPRPVILSFSRA